MVFIVKYVIFVLYMLWGDFLHMVGFVPICCYRSHCVFCYRCMCLRVCHFWEVACFRVGQLNMLHCTQPINTATRTPHATVWQKQFVIHLVPFGSLFGCDLFGRMLCVVRFVRSPCYRIQLHYILSI